MGYTISKMGDEAVNIEVELRLTAPACVATLVVLEMPWRHDNPTLDPNLNTSSSKTWVCLKIGYIPNEIAI